MEFRGDDPWPVPGGEVPAVVVRLVDAGTTRVTVIGDVDAWACRSLRAGLRAAVAAGSMEVQLDLSRTTLLSAAAVSVLVAARSRCRARGSRLRVVAASRQAGVVLRLAGWRGVAGQDDRADHGRVGLRTGRAWTAAGGGVWRSATATVGS